MISIGLRLLDKEELSRYVQNEKSLISIAGRGKVRDIHWILERKHWRLFVKGKRQLAHYNVFSSPKPELPPNSYNLSKFYTWKKIICKEGVSCIFFIILLLNNKDRSRTQTSLKSLSHSGRQLWPWFLVTPTPGYTLLCNCSLWAWAAPTVATSPKQNTAKGMDVAPTINLQTLWLPSC